MITKEDFESWREHAVTEAVFEALKRKGAEAKAAWVDASWQNGVLAPELLADLRATQQTCDYIRTMDHAELEAMLGEGGS